MVGYLKGYAYNYEITRVINQDQKVDYVFGIEIPCLEKRGKDVDLNKEIKDTQGKTLGINGIYIQRCLTDLSLSMKYADDTAFYCYRAIESLCRHCAAINELTSSKDSNQWEKFRDISKVSKDEIMKIKDLSDPLRHGGYISMTSKEREEIFLNTWDIVDKYLKNI